MKKKLELLFIKVYIKNRNVLLNIKNRLAVRHKMQELIFIFETKIKHSF